MWKRDFPDDALQKVIYGILNMLLETFIEWFSGCWNNQLQAYSNPRGQSFVHVIHEFDVDTFKCSYRHRRQPRPYRYFEASIQYGDGSIILKNPTHDIIFNLQGGGFYTNTRFEKHGILYINEAYLGAGHYHVKDQGFDLKSGRQMWGLDGDSFYEFRKS